MARKKTGKHAAKRPAGRGSSATMQRLEKDFRATPSRLSMQTTNEVRSLKQIESKLKSNSNKLKSKLKASESRMKTAKSKNTSAGRKQFATAKKLHGNNLKAHSALEKQIKENSSLLENATQRQAKFAALRKHLAQFEKDWAAKAKKTKASSKKAGKTKRRQTSKRDFARTQSETQQPQSPFQTQLDEDIRLDETTETTS